MRGKALLSVVAFLFGVPLAAAGAPHGGDDHADPGVSPSFALFPAHDEVVNALRAYEGHPWIRLHLVGNSTEGRAVWLAEVTDPSSPVPLEDRVVTFVFTQQHGNEPAGTPAALDVLGEIAHGGSLASALANQVLLLLPMANPDGAAADRRHNGQNLDINRDHIALRSPEARLLHEVLSRWDVHVAMDHHEYSGTGLGNPVPVRLYDYDLTTLYPTHGNVRASTDAMARGLMYDGVWPHAEEEGYSANEYGEQTVAGIPVEQIAGGPDPGIMRNHLGLHHVAGILVETRVDGFDNPFQDAARRTAIHHNVMEATLEYAHEHAAALIDAKRRAHEDSLAQPWTDYIEGEATGPIGAAYQVAPDPALEATWSLHHLPPGIPVGDAVVHNMLHELQAHAAAALHPASTRALVAGAVPTEAVPLPTEEAALEAPPKESGGLSLAAGLLAFASALVFLRRRP